ncbi:MAG: hypothetical protein QOD40_1964 [Alphaproteobacteria bacterium]|jgi:predicted ATP-binding protein involved in virulence|nr:hypothetical protein [Alphaproteobacteria bacterium]
MMIAEIEIENHPILGTITLNFRDPSGNVSNTIILAGENGTGKSVILGLIANLYNFQISQERRRNRFFLR